MLGASFSGAALNMFCFLLALFLFQAFVTILESGDSDESPEKTKAVDRTKQYLL